MVDLVPSSHYCTEKERHQGHPKFRFLSPSGGFKAPKKLDLEAQQQNEIIIRLKGTYAL
jgi:hypothetical protein